VRISKQKLDNYLHGDYTEYVNIDSAGHLRKIAFQPFVSIFFRVFSRSSSNHS
jgi:hypothetical protein